MFYRFVTGLRPWHKSFILLGLDALAVLVALFVATYSWPGYSWPGNSWPGNSWPGNSRLGNSWDGHSPAGYSRLANSQESYSSSDRSGSDSSGSDSSGSGGSGSGGSGPGIAKPDAAAGLDGIGLTGRDPKPTGAEDRDRGQTGRFLTNLAAWWHSRIWHLVCAWIATFAATIHLGLHRMKLATYEAQGITDSLLIAAAAVTATAVANLLWVGGPGAVDPGGTFIGQAVRYRMAFRDMLILGAGVLILNVVARLTLLRLVRAIHKAGPNRIRILVYGTGQTAHHLITVFSEDHRVEIAALVDDNPHLQNHTMGGLPVYAPQRIASLVTQLRIDRIVMALDSDGPAEQARITGQLRPLGVEILTLPSFAKLIADGAGPTDRTGTDLARLLGRNLLESALPGVSDAYRDRRILVTGAGGSIGSEICRQLAGCDPRMIVLLDHSELALFNIHRDLTAAFPQLEIVQVLGSVGEADLIRDILCQNKIDDVLHAAAYKHLSLVQANVIEGLRNNVLATRVLAEAARDHGVDRFILISSDKAVRPTSVMGATKRMAEQIVQDLATRQGGTRFAIVRFGNVIGSSGSVVPLFKEQIARGGPVTVTDPRVTRFFMTTTEAVRLVLLAGSFTRGGDVFALDMGAPVPVLNIARQMIEASGGHMCLPCPMPQHSDDMNSDPAICAGEHGLPDRTGCDHGRTNRRASAADTDQKPRIQIVFTGLKHGEKLEEEILIGSDMLTTPHPKILRANETHLSEIGMARALSQLRDAVDRRDITAATQSLNRWVESPGTDMGLGGAGPAHPGDQSAAPQ